MHKTEARNLLQSFVTEASDGAPPEFDDDAHMCSLAQSLNYPTSPEKMDPWIVEARRVLGAELDATEWSVLEEARLHGTV